MERKAVYGRLAPLNLTVSLKSLKDTKGWQSVKMQEEKEGVQGNAELSRTNHDLQKTIGTLVDKLRPLFISHCL